jgi:hypothetical protein
MTNPAVRPTRPESAGRRAQELSRLAALGGHPQGLALTATSTVPRSSRPGRCRRFYPFIVQLERAAAFARDDTGAASGDISYRVPNCSWRRPSHSALASHRAAIGITTSATPVVLSSSHRSSATDQAI